MDQVKIGKFIAERRKIKDLTQMQLAEMLGITDRAVSKWETGRSLPDSSLMLTLCGILGISVNDLLSGEVVAMDNYNKEVENNLLEMVKEKEQADKRLLVAEVVIGITATAVLLALMLVASLVQMETWLRVTLMSLGFLLFLAGCFYAVRIEQKAGYYECAACGHRSVPSYKKVLLASHFGRTRYMACPHCGEKTWQKKRLEKQGTDGNFKKEKRIVDSKWIKIAAIVLILAIVGVSLIVETRDLRYVCPDCDSTFEITFGEYSKAMHSFSKRKLTCPDCGATNMCEKYRGE